MENFLDATHFPWVHAGVNGVASEPDEINDYEVFQDQDGLHTSEVRVFQPYGDPREVPVHVGYSYRCMRPLIAYFSKRVEVADGNSEYVSDPGDRFCTFQRGRHTCAPDCTAITRPELRRRRPSSDPSTRRPDIVETPWNGFHGICAKGSHHRTDRRAAVPAVARRARRDIRHGVM